MFTFSCREAPREVAQLEKQTKKKAAADAEVKTRLSKLPMLANPLRQSTFSPTFSPRASSLKVLDIPPVIQEKMLDAVYAEKPELVERLSPLMVTTKAVLNSAFVGPRFEESVQQLLIARFDMFGLARRGQWVPIRDVFPGAIGCEDLLSTEVRSFLFRYILATKIVELGDGALLPSDCPGLDRCFEKAIANPATSLTPLQRRNTRVG